MHVRPLDRALIEHLARGLSYKQAALRMGLTMLNVRFRVRMLHKKLGTHDRTQLVLLAIASGLHKP